LLTIIYSFNKDGVLARNWTAAISSASNAVARFIPFNHGVYINPAKYIRAQLLDNLYFERNLLLERMYSDVQRLIQDSHADAIIVQDCHPYHPEFLRRLQVYKVIRTTDGPISAYDRDFAYAHAYDHVFYHSPAYSRDLNMEQKLRYCGVRAATFLPLGLLDSAYDHAKTEVALMRQHRDVDVLFVGALHLGKMPFLAEIMHKLGRKLRVHGIAGLKRNLYFNIRYGWPGWITPIGDSEFVTLYQRTKIGINVHNRGKFTVGNLRLFDLPANGVCQVSDGGEYLQQFFSVDGEEIVSYESTSDLIRRVEFLLANEQERERIALKGYRRVLRDHRFQTWLQRGADVIGSCIAEKRNIGHESERLPRGQVD
jgi:hypothetical protein